MVEPWQPTLKLRGITRVHVDRLDEYGKPVRSWAIQQEYRNVMSGEKEWRDIPSLTEEVKGE